MISCNSIAFELVVLQQYLETFLKLISYKQELAVKHIIF